MNHKKIRSMNILVILLLLIITGCSNKSDASVTPSPQPTRDPILEQSIEKQLAALNPEAISVYREATIALDAGKYERSLVLYKQLLVLVPNFSTAYRRLGSIELSLNNLDTSVELLRKAVEIDPNGYNQSALSFSLFSRGTPRDLQEAYDLSTSAAKLIPDDSQIILIWLWTSAMTNNMEDVKKADDLLLSLAPNDPFAHYFKGTLLAISGHWEDAERELVYSQKIGVPEELVQELLGTGIARNAMLIRLLRWGSFALVIWLLGLGALFLVGTFLSKATIKALHESRTSLITQVSPREQKVRSIYRAVIGLLSMYYYISMPFVIISLLLVVGGAFYIFLLIGSIPIQLSILLVIMLIGSLFAILRSLFFKLKDKSPGRTLQRMDAPELWTFVEDVAKKLMIRPVDSIFLSPGVGIAVYEKGSLIRKMRGMGQRNLILGMGVLPGLTQGQFAAIIAHEYGHFSNRDTAGGNLAFQVYATLNQMAQQLIQSRTAFIFNPAWLFVLAYQRIFLRVAHGASRLQEILADRYAAIAYGSTNLVEGLQNLIRLSITFPPLANSEIQNAINANHPIVYNIYNLIAPVDLSEEMKNKVDEEMNRITSEFDTHPAPQERIAILEKLNIPYSPMQDNTRPVLQLFPNPESLQREMTELIINSIKK